MADTRSCRQPVSQGTPVDMGAPEGISPQPLLRREILAKRSFGLAARLDIAGREQTLGNCGSRVFSHKSKPRQASLSAIICASCSSRKRGNLPGRKVPQVPIWLPTGSPFSSQTSTLRRADGARPPSGHHSGHPESWRRMASWAGPPAPGHEGTPSPHAGPSCLLRANEGAEMRQTAQNTAPRHRGFGHFAPTVRWTRRLGPGLGSRQHAPQPGWPGVPVPFR